MANQQAFFLSSAEILFNERQKEKGANKSRRSRVAADGSIVKKTSSSISYDCETCGLSKECRCPKIKVFGQGKKKILIVGEFPSSYDDRTGKVFSGEDGKYLKEILKAFDIDFEVDCFSQNVVRCKPSGDKLVTTQQMKCCYQNLVEDIQELKPGLIICMGGPAVWTLVDYKCVRALKSSSISQRMGFMNKIHGFVFPVHKFNCWIGCTYHPANVLANQYLENIFVDDIDKILSYVNKPLAQPLSEKEGNYLVEDSEWALTLLEELSQSTIPVAFDYETTSLDPYEKDAKLLYVSFAKSSDEAFCIWLENNSWNVVEQASVYAGLKKFLLSSAPKVVQNFNMEESWGRKHVGASANNLVMDTMITSHVINCKGGTTKLDFQVSLATGHQYKSMVDAKNIIDEDPKTVATYNCLDSRYTWLLYDKYSKFLNLPNNKKLKWFNDFLTHSLYSLVDMKERGIKVDLNVLDGFKNDVKEKSVRYLRELSECPAGKRFYVKFEENVNVESPKHLRDLFFGIYKIQSYKKTKSGDLCVDGEVIQKIADKTKDQEVKQISRCILEYKKITSLRKRIEEYAGCLDPDGFLHPEYLMNTAETFRSSASPNVQNIFKHDEELVKFRKCFIPFTSESIFLEADYDALEFKTCAAVTGDPNLINQIKNKMDPHRRWSSELFLKSQKDITDDERFQGKNGFVFASLYGAIPESIAKAMNLPLERVEAVQRKFWEEYHYVKEWQNRVLADYEKNGYIESVTGFRRYGPLSKEQLFNTPIQGPAFHLVLDGLVKANEEMAREGLKSRIISETHDSILNNVNEEEVEKVVEIETRIFCSKRFAWQRDVPLSISWVIGENYYDMTKIKF